MEHWYMMFLHSIIILVVLYLAMVYGLNQPSMKAEIRSVVIGAFVFIYMVVFGHGLPTTINKNLF